MANMAKKHEWGEAHGVVHTRQRSVRDEQEVDFHMAIRNGSAFNAFAPRSINAAANVWLLLAYATRHTSQLRHVQVG